MMRLCDRSLAQRSSALAVIGLFRVFVAMSCLSNEGSPGGKDTSKLNPLAYGVNSTFQRFRETQLPPFRVFHVEPVEVFAQENGSRSGSNQPPRASALSSRSFE